MLIMVFFYARLTFITFFKGYFNYHNLYYYAI